MDLGSVAIIALVAGVAGGAVGAALVGARLTWTTERRTRVANGAANGA